MDEIEYIRSNKGGQKIIYKGYMYTVHKNKKCGGIRWRCAQRSLNCKGSISTTSLGVPYLNIPHNHLPDSHSAAVARSKVFDPTPLDFHSFLNLLIHEQPVEQTSEVPVLDVTNVWEPLTEIEDEDMKVKTKNKIKQCKKPLIEHKSRLKQTFYDPEFKKMVVTFAEETGNGEARRKFGVSATNIRRWRAKSRVSSKQEKEKTPKKSNEKDLDSMPLQQRLKVPPPVLPEPSEPVLHSQPLSPTKLKVTRQAKPSQPSPKPPTPPPPPPPIEEVCLKWNSHHSNMQNTFPSLLLREQYVDATLVAEGQTLKCHRVILSSCSPYFEEVLASISPYQHPVLFMKDVPFWILKSLCDFMYAGEVHILQTKLEELLGVAENLKIKGLAGQAETKSQGIKPELPTIVKEETNEDAKKKDEKEIKKKEEKEIKKKEEKEMKKKDEKEIKKKEEKEVKPPEIKQPKRKDEKEIKKREEKEVKEKKRVQPLPPVEMPLLKTTKNVKIPLQHAEMPILKSAKPLRSSGASRRTEKKAVEKEKIEKPSLPKEISLNKDFLDPLLDLLEPVYEEVAQDPKPTKAVIPKDPKNVAMRRSFQKKIKKRKISDEREESPPPVFTRKGTRSRPNRKVPKYFHPPDDQSTIVREPHTDQADPLMHLQCIKSEPIYEDSIEIEDNLVGFSECSVSVEEQLIGSYDQTSFTDYGRRTTRSKQKELQPIIMDVHSIANKKEETPLISVAELRDPKLDPLEDPLTLNQSSSDSPAIVEAVDNTLGFRISHVMTEKEDSRSSEVCTDMGFQITNVITAQEYPKKSEGMDEEEEDSIFTEYEPPKIIISTKIQDCDSFNTTTEGNLSQVHDSEPMDTNEDDLLVISPTTSFHADITEDSNKLIDNPQSDKEYEPTDSIFVETGSRENFDDSTSIKNAVAEVRIEENKKSELMDKHEDTHLAVLPTTSLYGDTVEDTNELIENSQKDKENADPEPMDTDEEAPMVDLPTTSFQLNTAQDSHEVIDSFQKPDQENHPANNEVEETNPQDHLVDDSLVKNIHCDPEVESRKEVLPDAESELMNINLEEPVAILPTELSQEDSQSGTFLNESSQLLTNQEQATNLSPTESFQENLKTDTEELQIESETSYKESTFESSDSAEPNNINENMEVAQDSDLPTENFEELPDAAEENVNQETDELTDCAEEFPLGEEAFDEHSSNVKNLEDAVQSVSEDQASDFTVEPASKLENEEINRHEDELLREDNDISSNKDYEKNEDCIPELNSSSNVPTAYCCAEISSNVSIADCGAENSSNASKEDGYVKEGSIAHFSDEHNSSNVFKEDYVAEETDSNMFNEDFVLEESSSNVLNEKESSLDIPIVSEESKSNDITENGPNDNFAELDVPNECQETSSLPEPNCQTEVASSSNLPGFHIAQVVSEQIAEIEGSRVSDNFVNDSNVLSASCEKNYNELESIVNDLSKIVGDNCGERSLETEGMDDTNSIVDSLENLLQK